MVFHTLENNKCKEKVIPRPMVPVPVLLICRRSLFRQHDANARPPPAPPPPSQAAMRTARIALLVCGITHVIPFLAREPASIELALDEGMGGAAGSSRTTLVYKYPSQYPADYIAWAKLPNPSYTPAVVVPKGVDPDEFCATCCSLVQGLEFTLANQLHRENARPTKTMGVLDELAQEGVDSSCQYGPIWHDKKKRNMCKHIVEKHAEQLTTALVNFVSKVPDKLQNSSRLRRDMCWGAARACEAASAERWDPPQPKTDLTSQRPLSKENNRGPVFRAVGANIQEEIAKENRDLIIYVFFASSEQYETLNLGFERLAELLAPGRPNSLRFVALDAEKNDLPPVYGLHQITTDTISMYSATDKLTPTLKQIPDDGSSLLSENLQFLLAACKHEDSLAHVRALAQRIPDHMLLDSNWLSRASRRRLDKHLIRKRLEGTGPKSEL